jgi:hypothetical protein
VSDPITNIASLNEAPATLPVGADIATPRVKQPYSDQGSIGWSHQLNQATAIDVDFVHSDGHDLGVRIRPNQRDTSPTGPRHYSTLLAPFGTFSNANFRLTLPKGRSRFDGINFGIRRRMQQHFSYNAWYSLSQTKSLNGAGVDELSFANIQNHLDPFGDIQYGPAGRTDSRHRFTLSAVLELPKGFQLAPIYRFRSALPLNITEGVDVNQNGDNTDIATEAFAYEGLDSNHNPIFKSIGPCTTINCGRGAALSTMNLRVSKSFRLAGSARVEAIGEVFNLTNALNPGGSRPDTGFNGQRFLGTVANKTPNPDFMRPNFYSGDFQQPEQRIGQIGLRFTF